MLGTAVNLTVENARLLERVNALETLVMTNLPRVASLESWKTDCTRAVHDIHS